MVPVNLQNNNLIGDNWSPKSSMRTLKYFLENVVKHNSRVHHLSFSEHSYRKKLRIGYL